MGRHIWIGCVIGMWRIGLHFMARMKKFPVIEDWIALFCMLNLRPTPFSNLRFLCYFAVPFGVELSFCEISSFRLRTRGER